MGTAFFGTCVYGGGTMRGLLAFTKKEWMEGIRTYKCLIILIVFLAFGFMNPIFAKYAPELMSSMMPEGMHMELPIPTVLDSWTQFFKNISQMGLIIFMLMFSGVLSNEFQKGTLINMVTKGLSRKTILLSKIMYLIGIWTLCFGSCFLVTLGYGLMFWSEWKLAFLAFSLFCMWLFGVMLCCMLLLGSLLTRTSAGGLLLAGGSVVCFMLVQIVPNSSAYNPISLISENMAIIQGTIAMKEIYPAIGICLIIIIITYGLSVVVFQRKQL